jgi:hypothetical protein
MMVHLEGLDAEVAEARQDVVQASPILVPPEHRAAGMTFEGHVAERRPEPLTQPSGDNDSVLVRVHARTLPTARVSRHHPAAISPGVI